MLSYFVFGIIAMKLFGSIDFQEPDLASINPLDNFATIGHSMRFLFQITTGHPLTGLVMDCEKQAGNITVPFLFLFFMIGNFVYINLFIALVLENFVSHTVISLSIN